MRPRACRPYRAKTKGKVERVIREVKEDFLAWLTGQPMPPQPSSPTTTPGGAWAPEVVAARRHRTTGRIVGEAWAEERPLLGPTPAPAARPPPRSRAVQPRPRWSTWARLRTVGEIVEVRPLAVYEAVLG